MGGADVPCIGKKGILKYQQQHPGHDCPRRELEPGNAEAYELALVALGETTRPFVPMMLRDVPARERVAVSRRVVSALQSKRLDEVLYPKRKDSKAPTPQRPVDAPASGPARGRRR
jgi:hypothetical protein